MKSRRTHQDDQIVEYLRQRGSAPLPPRFTTEVMEAVARAPQQGKTRVLWFRPLLAAAVIVLAVVATLGGLTLIDSQVGDDATPPPAPSASAPSALPSPAPSGSPAVSASADAQPSATASAEATDPTVGVQPGDVLVSVTDDLVVRSAPSIESDSEIYPVRLQPGDLLRVLEGPVEASGFIWYRGAVLDPSMPDGVREGWVAEADQDGTLWLAAVPEAGDGWRLLGESTTGEPYSVGVATAAAELDALWADAGVADEVPTIDFEHELVVRYTHAVSSTCPEINLEGVGIDEAEGIVYSVVTRPSSPLFGGQTCTTDAQPHTFVVAVDRDRLPTGEVRFRLERGFLTCADCGREAEEVTVVQP